MTVKLKNVVKEGKTQKFKPRAEHLAKVLAGRKGGAMRDEKKDFKRAREKQKFQKELRDVSEALNPMDYDISNPLRKGFEAGKKGKPKTANPYKHAVDASKWDMGWKKGRRC